MTDKRMFPSFVDMWFLNDLAALAAFKRYIEIIRIAFDNIPDPVFARLHPVKKSENIHNFTPF
jgi:hypothetical protein